MSTFFDKPDLLVHPRFYSEIVPFDLQCYYNLLRADELERNDDPTVLLDDPTVGLTRCRLKLQPYYRPPDRRESGARPCVTSYELTEETMMYTVNRNGPRYVIWPMDEPLAVCATELDRVRPDDLYRAAMRAKSWAQHIERECSVIVFDLDMTLIDERNEKLPYADAMVNNARCAYDVVVLWSHGSSLHVDENVQKFYDASPHGNGLFDLVLSQPVTGGQPGPKNLLHVYNFLHGCRFNDRSTLVDDSPYNWTPEYTKLLIPGRRSLRNLINVT